MNILKFLLQFFQPKPSQTLKKKQKTFLMNPLSFSKQKSKYISLGDSTSIATIDSYLGLHILPPYQAYLLCIIFYYIKFISLWNFSCNIIN